MWDAAVRTDVRDGDRFAAQHRPAGYAIVQIEMPAAPERRNGILGDIVAQFALSQDDGDAISIDSALRRLSQHIDDVVERPCAHQQFARLEHKRLPLLIEHAFRRVAGGAIKAGDFA